MKNCRELQKKTVWRENNMLKAKPFVKWVGGKTQLLEDIKKALPRNLSQIKDVTYIEPLNVKRLEQIIAKERPDALLPNLGGQSGLNLCSELYQ